MLSEAQISEARVPTQTELRDAVFSRLDTYTETKDELPWLGPGADLAFADSVVGLGEWYARRRTIVMLQKVLADHCRPLEEGEELTSWTVRQVKGQAVQEVIDMLEAL